MAVDEIKTKYSVLRAVLGYVAVQCTAQLADFPAVVGAAELSLAPHSSNRVKASWEDSAAWSVYQGRASQHSLPK